jgi:hypothetical protein
MDFVNRYLDSGTINKSISFKEDGTFDSINDDSLLDSLIHNLLYMLDNGDNNTKYVARMLLLGIGTSL